MKWYRYNQKIKNIRTLKAFSKVLPTVLIGIVPVVIVVGMIILCNPKTLPFRQIKITASSDHINMAKLHEFVNRHIQGGFFSLNIMALQTTLMSLPWVHDVSVRRIWPNQLKIDLEEQKPIARWNKNQLITEAGEIFSPSVVTIPKNIPQLRGPNNDSKKMVLNRFQQFSQALNPFYIVVTTLSLTRSGVWSFVLNGHSQVFLGREYVDQRFEQFVHLYPKIIGAKINCVERIDLRYSNGLAIQWSDQWIPSSKKI